MVYYTSGIYSPYLNIKLAKINEPIKHHLNYLLLIYGDISIHIGKF